MTIKAVVMDFDGTIANTFGTVREILLTELAKRKIKKLSDQDWEDYYQGKTKQVLGRLGLGPVRLLWLIRQMQGKLNQKLNEVDLFEGVGAVIGQIKNRGLEVGVVSSNIEKNVAEVLVREGIEVSRIICGGTLLGKDRLINKYLKLEGLEPEEVIYVGDEVRDIEACHKVGVKIAAVSWGFNSKEALIGTGADWVITKPDELNAVVEKLI